MNSLPDIDLSRIRQYGTSQQRAFEELCYLLAWDMESLEGATELERRGTPDGGIEFSCVPPSSGRRGRWAWQAKYLFRFDASAFAQMTKSVIAALDSTPDLERYIFVLPKDRTPAGERRWANNVAEWRSEASSRGMDVEFRFRGESEILAALTRDSHAGAIRYFFDRKFLTDEFFFDQVSRAVEDLGARYDPAVNVETDAGAILDAACRGAGFVSRVSELVAAVSSDHLYIEGTAEEHPEAHATLATVREQVAEFHDGCERLVELISQPGEHVFSGLASRAEHLASQLSPVAHSIDSPLSGVAAEGPEASAASGAAAAARCRKLNEVRQLVRSVLRHLGALKSFLGSVEASAAKAGAVVLVGEAGCGKSHLVADVAKERVGIGLPSVLVLGQTLDEGHVGTQIVERLGLPGLSLDEALQALDVAARVRREGRALLMVDAINEGPGADLWRHQVRGLIAQFAKFDWVALVLTVRDVYEPVIAPDGFGSAVRSSHPGLSGFEEEALTIYSEHFGLRLPDVPALLPELSNPLFLRSLCLAVRANGLTEIPRTAANLLWVFDGLLDHAEQTLRSPSRLDYPEWERRVRDAASALASRMVDDDTESLTLQVADQVVQTVHRSDSASRSLLNGLIQEGLLLRERTESTPTNAASETVRFTYQRLSDHLRAQAVLERCESNSALAAHLRRVAKSDHRWSHRGVIGALALLLPTRRNTELAVVLRLGERVVSRSSAYRGSDADWLRVQAQDAFLETLIWRDPSTLTQRAMAMLDRYLAAGLVEPSDWLRTLVSLSCVPGHPLNVRRLDARLRSLSMAERDQAWTRQLHWISSDDSNPVDRIIDWAWSGDSTTTDVAELAGLTLSWFFTSTDPRLRDCSTKALVCLVDRHTSVMTGLVAHFAEVDDHYVLERVLAAAHGHLLRLRHRELDSDGLAEVAELGRTVFDTVFADEPPHHLMVRHRARSSVHLASDIIARDDLAIDRDLDRCNPPYGSSWPAEGPSNELLAIGFGREFSGYLSSVTPMDWEFEEKLRDHILRHVVLPDQSAVRAERRTALRGKLAARLAELEEVSPPSGRDRIRRRAEALASEMSNVVGPADSGNARDRWVTFCGGLSKKAQDAALALEKVANQLRLVEQEKMRPEAEACTRWVAGRILELGWTPDLFADQTQRHRPHSGQRETETVAKKYERIAVQELCGRLVDRCTIDDGWNEEESNYEGPWQISALLDADPSLLVRGDEPSEGTSAARLREIRRRRESSPVWYRPLVDHRLDGGPSDLAWLNELSDVPNSRELVTAVDPAGEEWVALERHLEFERIAPGIHDRYRADRRWLWFRCQAYLVADSETQLPVWAAETNWMGLRHLSTSQQTWLGEFGEFPDRGAWPSMIALADRERFWGDLAEVLAARVPSGWEFTDLADAGVQDFAYMVATIGCYQENAVDAAALDTPGALMPAPQLLAMLDARWTGGSASDLDSLKLGPTEREYSWESRGTTIAFCSAARGYHGARTLWVRSSALGDVLSREGLMCWSWVLGEKGFWKGGEPSADRTDVYGAVRLAPGSPLLWGHTVEEDREGSRRGDRRGRVLLQERPLGPRSA